MNKGGSGMSIDKLLRAINNTPGINQRTLSKICNISLGKVNSDIENLEFNRFITKEIKGREHKYYITKKGLLVLERQLEMNERIKLNLHIDSSSILTTAVILAAGRNKCFKEPVPLLEINEITLIERTISILNNNGIDNIIIVSGYKSELIKEKFENSAIVIENNNYKWTGTMESLSKAKPYLDGDFLLIEGDIVIEEHGLKEFINHTDRDCILITSESGSGDEGFVEIRDNRVYKISKDIAQLNRIDGEMIGISKISYEFFERMLELYKKNENPYMNYEYMMLDIARQYSLGYLKIDNLLWYEIDTLNHYKYVKDELISRIKKKEESMKLDDLKNILVDILKVKNEDIEYIYPIGGMTNKNFKVIVKGESYVLRVPGSGTENMISRNDEIKNAIFAHELKIDAELVYFNEITGIKISKFIENAETLTAESAKQQHNMKLVCDILRTLHKSDKKMENEFNIYNKIEEYEELLYRYNGVNFKDYGEVKEKIISLKDIVNKLEVKLTPCHNDTLASNFIKSGDDSMYLIDWEYGGMNDPMWDIAAHCLENGFSEEEEELFLKIYFKGNIDEKHKLRILINKVYQDFLWSIWTNIKEANGDDFGSYGIDRYNRAKLNLKILLERIKR